MDPTTTADSSTPLFHVAAIPYPGRGHVNPMLNLCRSLLASSSNNNNIDLIISFIVTEEWAHLITSSSPFLPSNRLRFVTIPNVLPSERNRGADIPGFMRAVQADMRGPVEDVMGRMQPKVDFVLTDALLPWAGDISKRSGVPVVALWTHSATVLLACLSIRGSDSQGPPPVDYPGKEDKALAYLPRVLTPRLASMASNGSDLAAFRGFLQIFSWFTTAQGLLLSSLYELESQVIDNLKSNLSLPIYAAGPCIPYMTVAENNTRDSYFKWLDLEPNCSVLYISLGSVLSASSAQVDEMVMGLNASGICYLWVTRDENQWLKELDGEHGMVVPWCDQLRVLCHPSVGGFLTHCGWGSTMEGVYAGVPMLTYPLIWDQYPNSKMIVDDLKIGLRLRDEEQIEKVIGREEVTRIVKELMDLEAEESKQRRRRAEELKAQCQRSVGEGGSSAASLDALVQDMISKKN